MKKITIMTFGLLLAATPAFADVVVGNAQDGSANVNQTDILNSTGNAWNTNAVDSAGNGGVQNVGVSNSAGVINQNVNTGATSNVGSATNVAITSGFSERGGNIDAGNPNDTSAQLASANLNQINAYNSTGNALCYGTTDSTYSAGINQVGVNGSQGVIGQSVNAGVSSNVGSATAITIH
jgi:hypothetical protein